MGQVAGCATGGQGSEWRCRGEHSGQRTTKSATDRRASSGSKPNCRLGIARFAPAVDLTDISVGEARLATAALFVRPISRDRHTTVKASLITRAIITHQGRSGLRRSRALGEVECRSTARAAVTDAHVFRIAGRDYLVSRLCRHASDSAARDLGRDAAQRTGRAAGYRVVGGRLRSERS